MGAIRWLLGGHAQFGVCANLPRAGEGFDRAWGEPVQEGRVGLVLSRGGKPHIPRLLGEFCRSVPAAEPPCNRGGLLSVTAGDYGFAESGGGKSRAPVPGTSATLHPYPGLGDP